MTLNVLKKTINECVRCPLYQNMPDGCKPVAGIGLGQYMVIVEKIGNIESILEEPVSVTMKSLVDHIFNRDVYITALLKCKTDKPKKKDFEICSELLEKELTELKPKAIFTMGKVVSDFCQTHYSKQNIVPLPALNTIMMYGTVETQKVRDKINNVIK